MGVVWLTSKLSIKDSCTKTQFPFWFTRSRVSGPEISLIGPDIGDSPEQAIQNSRQNGTSALDPAQDRGALVEQPSPRTARPKHNFVSDLRKWHYRGNSVGTGGLNGLLYRSQ